MNRPSFGSYARPFIWTSSTSRLDAARRRGRSTRLPYRSVTRKDLPQVLTPQVETMYPLIDSFPGSASYSSTNESLGAHKPVPASLDSVYKSAAEHSLYRKGVRRAPITPCPSQLPSTQRRTQDA